MGGPLQDLIGFLSEIHSLRTDLFLHQQGLDTTTTPAGKAMFQMMEVFAEFERAMIQARGRAQGKRLGRPTISAEIEEAIRVARENGLGIRAISRQYGVGSATVRRVVLRA